MSVGWGGMGSVAVVAACVGLLGLSGCNRACRDLAERLCSDCAGDMEDFGGEAYCGCVETGVVVEDDGSFDSDDEAQQWCDRLRFSLDYQGSDGNAGCAEDLEYLQQWGSAVCEEVAGYSGYYY